MPIEWVGESLSTAYSTNDTRPVDPMDRSMGNRERRKLNTGKEGRSFKNPYNQTLARRSQRFEQAVYAKEIMQTRLQTVSLTDPLAHVLDYIVNHDLEYLPVLDRANKLAGLISYREILDTVARKRSPEDVEISEVMPSKVLTATGNTTLHELSRVMVMENIACVPIVDNAQKLIGMITTSDMMQCVVNHSKLNVWI